MRTPLTLIAGYAEAMRDLPGENTPENAQIIVDESNRLNRLVGDVLDLSKLQSGALELRPAPYNLTRSLRAIVARLSEFTRADGYEIRFEADAEVLVNADESCISQAFYNLLTNAINFTGADKCVTARLITAPAALPAPAARADALVAPPTGDTVTIEVTDTGQGIEADELPYIWERYYRTGNKHRRAVVGSGIGLSIVKSA
ncbi:MAG: HAMP domain-containing histidine kinase, partial [Clostridiales bacterium]|nr:HAMP domain-containing histidine kinase [Clostridiales bacterium]